MGFSTGLKLALPKAVGLLAAVGVAGLGTVLVMGEAAGHSTPRQMEIAGPTPSEATVLEVASSPEEQTVEVDKEEMLARRLDIVEEELLLGVPQVPRNPATDEVSLSTGGEEVAAPAGSEEKTHRPFEGLAALMKDLKD